LETNEAIKKQNERLVKVIRKLLGIIVSLVICIVLITLYSVYQPDVKSWFSKSKAEATEEAAKKEAFDKWDAEYKLSKATAGFWTPANLDALPDGSAAKTEILYGRELIAHTSKYLGPNGTVSQISNGLNCQNCHLDAGTKAWGSNFGAVFATYPKYRGRSGKVEDISKRINDCMERSLNGKPLALESREMLAIKTYIEFIGKNVTKGQKPKGTGIFDLPFLNRPANPANGKSLFLTKCQSCHQPNGEGLLTADKTEYTYPPLWGSQSYNCGAGLYRMSRFAGYIKYNMPNGATYQNPQLSDEEAWDIAAFINSQPRPVKDLSKDWPKITEKPFDYPFGPFADNFTEQQHKYGPFRPIDDEIKSRMKK